MSRRLRTFVHVDGRAYGPGDEVPDEVADQITNPDVWDEDTDDEPDADRASPRRPARSLRPKS